MNMTEERCGQAEREDVLAYFLSDSSDWQEARTKKQLLQAYSLHRPVHYDIYLDLNQGKRLARGEAMELSDADVCVLFRMITEGIACTSEMIFKARYKRELEPGNKKDRGRLDSYYRRLKERLKLYGITTEHYTVRPGTTYFIIYPEHMAGDSTKR